MTDLDADGRTILRYIYTMDVKVWSGLNWLRIYYSNRNEVPASKEGESFLYKQSNWHLP
jgi:hypothetical protein